MNCISLTIVTKIRLKLIWLLKMDEEYGGKLKKQPAYRLKMAWDWLD